MERELHSLCAMESESIVRKEDNIASSSDKIKRSVNIRFTSNLYCIFTTFYSCTIRSTGALEICNGGCVSNYWVNYFFNWS